MSSLKSKILVVDDEIDILESVQAILEDAAYIVVTTTKGECVEQLLTSTRPDLILLDIFLSGLDGREIANQLKSQDSTRHIPIIIFSAHGREPEVLRNCRADDFLAKPFDIDKLLKKIDHYL